MYIFTKKGDLLCHFFIIINHYFLISFASTLDSPLGRIESNGENPQDIKIFDTLIGLMLKEWKVKAIEVSNDVFDEGFKTSLMKEDMDMIISLNEVLFNYVIYYLW